MKSNSISKGIFCVVLMATLIIPFSAPLMAGDSYFEKGKRYKVQIFGSGSEIAVLSKPDDFGWIRVKFLSKWFIERLGDEGAVNINQIQAAKEIK